MDPLRGQGPWTVSIYAHGPCIFTTPKNTQNEFTVTVSDILIYNVNGTEWSAIWSEIICLTCDFKIEQAYSIHLHAKLYKIQKTIK